MSTAVIPSAAPPASSASSAPEATEASVLEEIRRIVREELEQAREVLPAHGLQQELELDSLGLITLAVGLENRFRVKLSDEDAVGIVTVGDLVALVVRRRAEAGAGAGVGG